MKFKCEYSNVKLLQEANETMTAYVALLNAIKSDKGKKLLSYVKHPIGLTKALVEYIRRRDSYTCQLCGLVEKDRTFNVHHEDGSRVNNDPDNLITLCQSCHAYAHNPEKEEDER